MELIENNLEQKNNLKINNEIKLENIEEKQNKFLESTLGKTINTAVDIGLRAVLPDIVEDGIIDIKNTMIKEGFKEGINTGVKSAINLGKSAVGIVTGKFESVSQAYNAVKSGGVLDTTSKVIDTVIKSANKNGLLKDGTAKLIKKGKNVIKECVSDNIEKTFMEQIDGAEKIGKYISNWNTYLQKKDLTGMSREYKKIKDKLDNLIPIEETLKQARGIENIQILIKNKGNKLENITKEELELAKRI